MTTPSPPDAAAWDAELAQLEPSPSLLQTWAWGEVQANAGWKVDRVRLPSGGRATVLLRRTAGRWWGYVPRGPVPAAAVAELVEWARQSGLVRLRVEPDGPPELAAELGVAGFTPRPDATPQQPRHSSIVQLKPNEDDLLGSFKPKTRYNIRLALKRGVTVEATHDADELVRQAAATEARQGIRLPRLDYYRRLLGLLPWANVYVARHEGDALAAILVARHAGRAYYLFGGSSGTRRELMPMYAAQWQAMREAAADGLSEYDLWGVPPSDDPDHPWHGLMQFKAGFNGRRVEYCGPWDNDLRRTAVWVSLAEGARDLARRFLHKD
jgi:lipid II:glycine glycyltransferase (peptidoglycan interpeptide bridge formation enzyme)